MQSRNQREGRYVGKCFSKHKRLHWDHKQKGPGILPPHVGWMMAEHKVGSREKQLLKAKQY